jgi:pimeloyl-ACP methyl ester carboxylesterase
MTGDELLRAGIAAARAGDLPRAARHFAQLVQQEPGSMHGWLGLGSCTDDPQKREACFRRVLEIDPRNAVARQQLERMGIDPDQASPLRSARAVPGPAAPTAQSRAPLSSSPFLAEDETGAAAGFAADEYSLPDLPPVEQASEPTPQAGQASSRRRQASGQKVFVWSMLASFVGVGACGALLWFSGALASILPTGSLPTRMPTVAVPPTVSPTRMPPTATVPTSTPSATLVPSPGPTTVYEAVLEEAPCWFYSYADVEVDCGYVLVPQDRTDPESPTIKLAYVRYHSQSASPAAEPVMFLQGGPGGEAVMLSSAAFSILVEPFLAKYDFIAYDQRGTGLSEPALGCDELTRVFSQDLHGTLPASSRTMIYETAFRSCHGQMTVTQIDLNQFNTVASAADVRDVLLALGYQQVHLYGASYGTRLAQVVMRDDPEIVRSAILDSVVPIEALIYNDDFRAVNSSLTALFESCAADVSCSADYPDLETVFWDTVATLDSDPLTISVHDSFATEITQTVNGSLLIWLTTGMLREADWIGYAPAMVDEIHRGDYTTFEWAQSGLPFMFEGIDLGLYISVMCHEHIMTTTPAELAADLNTGRDMGFYFLPFIGDAQDMFDDCRVWGSRPPYPGENTPLVSDIPSLVIAGSFDPATPPFYSQQVAARLSRSTYVEFPNMGHCPTASDSSGCAMKIVLSFLDHPESGPDTDCLSRLEKIEYAPPTETE